MREINRNMKHDDYVCIDPTDGKSKPHQTTSESTSNSKVRTSVVDPYRVRSSDVRAPVFEPDGIAERVSADRSVYAPSPSQSVLSMTIPKDFTSKSRTEPTCTVEKLPEHCINEKGQTEFLGK